MSWVRIDDQAITHPKVVGLSDKAFRLWVWGLSYSQQHLTDGLIPIAALPYRLKRAADDLTKAVLWETHDIGFKVHDYLDWNDSREVVLARRDGARNALRKHRMKCISDQTSENPLARSGVGVEEGICSSEREFERKPIEALAPSARSKRPIFTGQRLVVFDWMLDGLMRTLGPHAEAFGLDEWFFTLDAQAARSGQVIPQRDGGQWLQAQTLAEAKRRGLPVATAVTPEQQFGKQTTRLMAALANLSDERPA